MRERTRRRIRTAGATLGLGLLGIGPLGCGDSNDTPPAKSASSWHGYRAGHWPPASWRPYASSSPFNQRIPAGTRPLAGSDAMITQTLRFGPPGHLTAGVAETPDDWGIPPTTRPIATRSSRCARPPATATTRSRACASASPTRPSPPAAATAT